MVYPQQPGNAEKEPGLMPKIETLYRRKVLRDILVNAKELKRMSPLLQISQIKPYKNSGHAQAKQRKCPW